ncbi:hypothetical protein GON03_07690 [Nocardioides sp. MAH-18]|uniref:Uncharacterized protein n=1 Tax=Nocardioides agri TaxID=2682843 RepID=A0A6L6XP07_9ACTN|nr:MULTISPECIES: hypothetical protein [unclassified Nocardioides]MBA2954199.1 hypothetical protein [Nocardioides sp. CGMCC 1.13656]MVQ49061.1 hypothetical protein [Nocardioides sp. MAH-18]
MTSTRLRGLAGLAVAAAVTLSGCGSVPALNGGVAARVAGESVTLEEVADTAAAYCSAVETQLQDGQTVANSVVSSQVAGSLALRAASEQFAADQGVTADAAYDQARDDLEANLSDLTDTQKEAVRAVNLARPYALAVQLAVGKQLGADDDAAAEAGADAFDDWLDDNDVRIDPRFGIALEGGEVTRTDTDISRPVSEKARAATSTDDQTFSAGLPSTQRCG